MKEENDRKNYKLFGDDNDDRILKKESQTGSK
jgi:hypothetical protein